VRESRSANRLLQFFLKLVSGEDLYFLRYSKSGKHATLKGVSPLSMEKLPAAIGGKSVGA